jgi:predicted PurR-regulated permease PerM
VAAVQGALGGTAFALLGIDAPVFWGVVMAFFCILPLGAWVIWLPAALWLIATGAMLKGLILVGVGVGIVSLADNFLRPALLSERAQMNGLIIFISLLGGMSVFGLLGVVLGPILVATAAGLVEAYTNREVRSEE